MGASKWTRAQVARRLGVSKSSVRLYEFRGELPFTVDKNGVHVFDPVEVERFAERRGERRARRHVQGSSRVPVLADGETQARVFEMLEADRDHRQIVKELRIPVEVVRALWLEWKTSNERSEQVRAAERTAAQNRKLQREVERRHAVEDRRRHELELEKLRARNRGTPAPAGS